MSFEFAKNATLQDLAATIDDVQDVEQVLDVIRGTLGQSLSKNASRDDIEARLGVENVCYSFLKNASEYFNDMEVNDEYEALVDIFAKTAAEAESSENAAKKSMRERASELYGRAKSKVNAARNYTHEKAVGAVMNHPKKTLGAAALGAAALGAGGYLAGRNMSRDDRR